MKRVLKQTAFFLLLLLVFFSLSAQDGESEEIYDGLRFDRPQINFSIHGRSHLNLDDIMAGFGGGIIDRVNLWGISLGWDFRLGRRPILKQESSNTYYQYLEKRKYIYAKAEKLFFFYTSDAMNYGLGMFADFRGGVYYGNYNGTAQRPNTHWTWSPGGGFAMNIGNRFYLKLGYHYMDVQSITIASHWGSLALQIRLDS